MTKERKIKIGILGAGKMGEALVSGLRHSPLARSGGIGLRASTRTAESAREVEKRMGIPCSTDNRGLARACDVVVLCVKPQQARAALEGVSRELARGTLLLSVCASVTTSDLRKWSGGRCAVVRVMPNTPALVNEGMSVLAPGPGVTGAQIELAERIFGAVGRTTVVEEPLMDGVTGLSGCGPAFMFLILEALGEAGVKVGLARKTATLLAAQTMLGAARMALERGEHPAALKDEVTTPAGCTIDGLMALEEGKLRIALIKAVVAAAARSATLKEGRAM